MKDAGGWKLNQITEKVIDSAFTVGNVLGCGFLEKVYENSLAYELRKVGLRVEQQYAVDVKYDGAVVGQFFTDLLVEKQVVVELKAVKALEEKHFAQCLNYLRATNLDICILLNFGTPRIEYKRIINNF